MAIDKSLNIAVVGATGIVGNEVIRLLGERRFPPSRIRPLASERSAGDAIEYLDDELAVEELGEDSFNGIDLAFFCAGAQVSQQSVPDAITSGAVVIDNSSAFRNKPGIPLVVPEVNPEALKDHKGIVANPNCSTIQLVVALNPLHRQWNLQSIDLTSLQSASGAGRSGMGELAEQTTNLLCGEEISVQVHARRLGFNVVPQIGEFDQSGFSAEERKLMSETATIMGIPELKVAATAVRVPVFVGHSISASARFEKEGDVTVESARQLLKGAPGVVLMDDPASGVYPTVLEATEHDPVFVGRIRQYPDNPGSLLMWIVADNLRKGAALNAMQIADLLFR